jgi:hypothetical protein
MCRRRNEQEEIDFSQGKNISDPSEHPLPARFMVYGNPGDRSLRFQHFSLFYPIPQLAGRCHPEL